MLTSMLEVVTRFMQAHRTLLLLIVVLLVAWLFLHNQSTELASVDDFDRRTRSGQPVVAMLFSNT